MTEFLHVALSFPTAPWTALLTLIAAAALLALLGAIDGISGGVRACSTVCSCGSA